jgi:phage terminase large subunit-like protein
MYFAEWSPPPGADLTNPDNWRYANPAIGHTLELDTLIDESRSPNRGAFLRASLNMWVSTDSSWLEPGTWDALSTTVSQPVTTVLAFDSSQDESRYCGVIAGLLPDGRCMVSTAFQTNTETEAWQEVRRLLPAGSTLAVTPSLEIHTPPELRRQMMIVGYAELCKWTGMVRSMIVEGRICHRGDPALADHIARAVAVKTQNGVTLSSQKSPGPIELARCAVWASALATKAKWSARPAMGAGRRDRLSP